MKKILSVILALSLLSVLCSCSRQQQTEETSKAQKTSSIVIYFSCTGTTEQAAKRIAELSSSDIYKIEPAEPYTSDDLNYNNSDCRANVGQNDPDARPEIAGYLPDLSEYDRVYLGFPIWWGTNPKIINTFIASCNLAGKEVFPFCTSGGSGVEKAADFIKNACPKSDVKDGIRANGATDEQLKAWINQ